MMVKLQKTLAFVIVIFLFLPTIIFAGGSQNSGNYNMIKEPNILFSYIDIDPYSSTITNRSGYKGHIFVIGFGQLHINFTINASFWFWDEYTEKIRHIEYKIGGLVWWKLGPIRYRAFSDASYDLIENKTSTWEITVKANNEIIGYDNCYYGHE